MIKHFHAISVFLLIALLGACSGGANNPAPADPVSSTPPEGASPTAANVSFDEDIQPILDNKCTGCHNDTPDAIGPLDLQTESKVMALRSAILSSLENRTMPLAEAPQLTPNERAKFIAWLTESEYFPVLSKVSLINQNAWDVQARNRDAFFSHRPSNVSCDRGKGWEVEDGEIEIDTEFCNYAGLTQQLLLDLEAGQEIEVALSHSDLNFNAPATAHFAIAMGGEMVMEREIAIPNEGGIIKQRFSLPNSLRRGDEIELHLHNHGANSWTLHSIDAFVEGEPSELDFCQIYDSTFEAIQETILEGAGCTNSLCHGDASAGGLDLRREVAYQNILDVDANNSSLTLINPRRPNQSFLYQKLVEKTFPGTYPISGSPMPSAGDALSAGQLEAIRIWIEAGAPETGSVADTLGRGENELEQLLGVCLPEPEAVGVVPLEAPPQSEGVQFKMPSHEIDGESERELCFATYYDFREQVPEQYLDETRDHIFIRGQEVREDPFTHHNVMLYSGFGADQLDNEVFGAWSCSPSSGDLSGQGCDPSDQNSCGTGMCRSEPKNSIACRGFGPGPAEGGVLGGLGVSGGINEPGFFKKIPSHGIFYWNSHAFNLTTEDAIHRVWRNMFLTDDLRFGQESFGYSANIFKAHGVPPFSKETVCADYTFEEGDQLLNLSSHTHKRGGLFTMTLKSTGEQIYESYNYDEPVMQRFDPPMLFDSPNDIDRTIEYCAEYTNGLNPDGSMNVETVVRKSRKPERSFCEPVACAEGNVGQSCSIDDHTACDTSPGAGDGFCDACTITRGITSDDEMFLPLITRLVIDDDAVSERSPRVHILLPGDGQIVSPGETIALGLQFENFTLMAPSGHDSGDGTDMPHEHDMGSEDDGGEHANESDDHASAASGHYHVYLNWVDDADDHLTAWDTQLGYTLPADLPIGEHTIRVSLRAADHHAVGVHTEVTVVVQ